MIYHHGGFPFIIDFIRDISSIATCMRNSCTRIFGLNKLFNFQLSSPQQNTLAYQYPTTWDMSVTSLSQNRKMLCARLFWGCSLEKMHMFMSAWTLGCTQWWCVHLQATTSVYLWVLWLLTCTLADIITYCGGGVHHHWWWWILWHRCV